MPRSVMQLVTGDVTASRGVRLTRINPWVPEGPPRRPCVTGGAPSPDVCEKMAGYPCWQRCLLFLGKINSVLRCSQKLSHTRDSATFIEPAKKHTAHVQRRSGRWVNGAVCLGPASSECTAWWHAGPVSLGARTLEADPAAPDVRRGPPTSLR